MADSVDYPERTRQGQCSFDSLPDCDLSESVVLVCPGFVGAQYTRAWSYCRRYLYKSALDQLYISDPGASLYYTLQDTESEAPKSFSANRPQSRKICLMAPTRACAVFFSSFPEMLESDSAWKIASHI